MVTLSQLSRRLPLIEQANSTAPHVFVDCDEVLADFLGTIVSHFKLKDEHAVKAFLAPPNGWDAVTKALPNVFEVLKPMPDAAALVSGVTKLRDQGEIKLSVLTALPKPWMTASQRHLGDAARNHKKQWIARHFPSLGASSVITCQRSDKALYGLAELVATGIPPVLIDDNKSNIKEWKAATRSLGILHTSAADSLKQLHAYLNR